MILFHDEHPRSDEQQRKGISATASVLIVNCVCARGGHGLASYSAAAAAAEP
eukprot:COSAG01_NODE_69320_length_261_cov_1.746914_1_plen_51_part_10